MILSCSFGHHSLAFWAGTVKNVSLKSYYLPIPQTAERDEHESSAAIQTPQYIRTPYAVDI